MNKQKIENTINQIFSKGKGILATDERKSSIEKKFKNKGIDIAKADSFREFFFSSDISKAISGVILAEDTYAEHFTEGKKTVDYLKEKGISVGIKLDLGLEGHDEALSLLSDKCKKYDADFTKWRVVIKVGDGEEEIEKNINVLAKYSEIVQENSMLPIVEPEVLMSGDHSIEDAKATMDTVLKMLLEKMKNPELAVLKTSFVTDGYDKVETSPEIVAEYTKNVFDTVGVNNFGGVVFLSGGLSTDNSYSYLRAFRNISSIRATFSYGRALQDDILIVWNEFGKGDEADKKVNEILNRASCSVD